MFDSIISSIQSFFLMFRVTDLIDIIIIAFVCYKIFELFKETRAKPIIKAIMLIVAATFVSGWLHLNTVSYILRNLMQFGVTAILILFQPELRRGLEKIGRTNFAELFSSDEENAAEKAAEEIAAACAYMSARKIGALIVLERTTKINDIVRTGCDINGDISRDLLINIFIPNTPLHDGAVIIREGKVIAARCILPLTKNEFLSSELGTRHRAAIGLTEVSDAAVVVVSEETGKISLAADGDMSRNYTEEPLKKAINKFLSPNTTSEDSSHGLGSKIGGFLSWKK